MFDWDSIDQAAEREAEAIRKGRRYISCNYRRPNTALLSRNQAVFDEQLEVHHAQCSFCGRTLKPSLEPDAGSTSLRTSDCDICNQCKFLHQLIWSTGHAQRSSQE